MVFRLPHRVSSKADALRGAGRTRDLSLITPRFLAGERVSDLPGGRVVPAVTTQSTAGAWSGDVDDFTFDGADIGFNAGDQSIKNDNSFPGDFDIDFTLTVVTFIVWGIWEITSDGNFASGTNDVSVSHDPSWGFGNQVGQLTQGSSSTGIQAWSPANGSVIKITRRGSTFKVYDDGVLIHTWSSTSTNEVRFGMASHSSAPDIEDFSWTLY